MNYMNFHAINCNHLEFDDALSIVCVVQLSLWIMPVNFLQIDCIKIFSSTCSEGWQLYECNYKVGSSTEGTALEQHLLEALLATLIRKDQVVENAYTFLEANSGFEPAQQLLELWRWWVLLSHCYY